MPENPPPAPAPDHRRLVAVIVVLALLGAIGGYVLTAVWLRDDPSSSHAAAPAPTTAPRAGGGATVVPTEPDANVLDGLVVRSTDVSADNLVVTIPGGRDVGSETTLDLCNGTFPSESQRTARRQVQVIDSTLTPSISTEAVLYRNPSGAVQAFSELRRVASQCPPTPVASPVGEPTVTTQFLAPPDGSWGTTNAVERQAYAFTTTDDLGNAYPGASVYLRRGRVLMGLYFSQPDGAQIAVDGNTTIRGIVAVFEHRMAALPASVVNG
jgi:hypothetical protein